MSAPEPSNLDAAKYISNKRKKQIWQIISAIQALAISYLLFKR